jgi:hypothetical protein
VFPQNQLRPLPIAIMPMPPLLTQTQSPCPEILTHTHPNITAAQAFKTNQPPCTSIIPTSIKHNLLTAPSSPRPPDHHGDLNSTSPDQNPRCKLALLSPKLRRPCTTKSKP